MHETTIIMIQILVYHDNPSPRSQCNFCDSQEDIVIFYPCNFGPLLFFFQTSSGTLPTCSGLNLRLSTRRALGLIEINSPPWLVSSLSPKQIPGEVLQGEGVKRILPPLLHPLPSLGQDGQWLNVLLEVLLVLLGSSCLQSKANKWISTFCDYLQSFQLIYITGQQKMLWHHRWQLYQWFLRSTRTMSYDIQVWFGTFMRTADHSKPIRKPCVKSPLNLDYRHNKPFHLQNNSGLQNL